jgi:hypothetical protein
MFAPPFNLIPDKDVCTVSLFPCIRRTTVLIRVFYTKGYYDLVRPEFLDYLIETQKIKYFFRSSGKVVVGVDKVRLSQQKPYSGNERRTWSKKVSYRKYV